MPAKAIKVNLIGQDDLDHSPWGRLITWATTYGRYTMVLTEIVVLLAFVSRFSLDRKLTDLKEEISQKQAILEANLPLEKDIRALQEKLAKTKELLSNQNQAGEIFGLLQSLLPSDVFLNSFDFSNNKINAKVVAGTNQGFSKFLSALNTHPKLTDVEIGEIKKQPTKGIQFQISAKLKVNKSTQ